VWLLPRLAANKSISLPTYSRSRSRREAYSLISYADIVLGMITIGVLGLGCSWLIRAAGRVMLPWLQFTKLGERA
jgi:hypothetical protein